MISLPRCPARTGVPGKDGGPYVAKLRAGMGRVMGWRRCAAGGLPGLGERDVSHN